MDNGYIVKFKNFAQSPEGTGKLHYQVLAESGQCIWGQWTANGNPMNQSTYERMNKETPFYLYALDNNFALLKMKVERVLFKEEVLNENLGYLIPAYYSIDTPCANYYLISSIDILPVEEAFKVIISSSGNSILGLNQVNSRSPIKVEWNENSITVPTPQSKPASYMPPIDLKNNNNQTEAENNHSYTVYRYKSKIDGKCYIGLSGNFKERVAHHKNPANWCSKKEKWKVLYMFFMMYGYENFDLTVLHEGLTKEEAQYWEAKEIENHNCYYPNGFNVRDESKHLKNI